MKIMHRILSTILMTVFISFGAVAETLYTAQLSPESAAVSLEQSSARTTGKTNHMVQYGGGGGAFPIQNSFCQCQKICF